MEPILDCQAAITALNKYYHVSSSDSEKVVKNALQEIIDIWPDVLTMENRATDDELFALNVSRAAITQVFTIFLSKDAQEDQEFTRDIFFTCFDILVQHIDVFSKNQSTFINSNIRLILKMLTSITSSLAFQSTDFSDEKRRNLLVAIREHVDNDDTHDDFTEEITSFVWNLSDKTLLVPVLLETGYANSVMDWLKKRERKFRDDKLTAPLHILHNLLRHDDGIDQLNNYHPMDVIDKLEINHQTDDRHEDLAIHIAMVRALLSDSKTIKSDSKHYSHEIIDMLVQLTINAAQGERYRHDGSHVSEPLTVLVKLFSNDQILDYVMSKVKAGSSSLIETLSSLLTKFYSDLTSDEGSLENYTCVSIFNLFLVISNHQRYHSIIMNQQTFMNTVRKATEDRLTYQDTFMVRTMKRIPQAAKEILMNLNNE